MVKLLNYKGFLAHLKNKKFTPVYLFTGGENFLKQQAIDLFKKILLSEQALDLNFHSFYAKEANFEEILSAAKTLPFNNKYRLILIKDLDLNDEAGIAIISRYSHNPCPHAVLVITILTDKDTDIGFLKGLSETTTLVQISALTNKELQEYITESVLARGKLVDFTAVTMLLERLGDNLEALTQGIEKLVLYAGQKKNITVQDIEAIISPQLEQTVFEIVRAVSVKNSGRALVLLQNIWQGDRTAMEIIGIMLWHIKRFSLIKERLEENTPHERLCDEFKLNSYHADKILKQAASFKSEDFAGFLKILLDTDLSIKTGRIEPRVGVETLLVKMCA